METAAIQFQNISKHFAGIRALDSVSFTVGRGEVHGLVGENGAGKSTLGKILAGIHRPDSGRIMIEANPASFASPREALRAGVGMVHQELAFCPMLSVAENLVMGQYPRRMGMLLDRPAMRRQAQQLLARIGVEMDVDLPMRALSTAQEQLVQIAAALGIDARILVFDEPTSSLSQPESARLFSLIESLRSRGVTMIYVSHRLPELRALCDRISVLRDGRYVGCLHRADASEDALVQMMIGRSISALFPREVPDSSDQVMMSVQGLTSPGVFDDVSFQIRCGEILGMAGLVGAGRSEVAKAIFGLDPHARGRIEVDGNPMRLGSVREALRRGVALVPEDRKRQGLILAMSGRANLTLPILRRLSRMAFLRKSREGSLARDQFQRFDVRARSIETPVLAMSGGNQQKIALAKWLSSGAKVLIVDEPTRGVDIGAKAAIHQLLADLARDGVAILLISSELPEILHLASRIVVMRQGRIVGELNRDQASEEHLLRLMAGVTA